MCPSGRNGQKNFILQETGLDNPSNMRQAFSVLDRDGDGRIVFSDLQEFFSRGLGKNMSKEDIESMIYVADLNRNGSVEFEEFEKIINMFKEKAKGKKVQEDSEMSLLKEAFTIMDRDGDGVVSLADLNGLMDVAMQRPMSQEDVVAMIEVAGGSVNSGVCYEDFVGMMQKNAFLKGS
eukprot:Gb_05639 [translate_table: standard]